jgi:hypothetical protein
MRRPRRWLALVVPAALAALLMGCAAPAAPAPHADGVATLHVQHRFRLIHIHPGLVRDCEDIELRFDGSPTGLYIAGNGAQEPVTLKTTGSCFTLVHEFTEENYLDPVTATYETSNGWQYQADGHCLWMNDKSYELELGAACNASDTSEDFYSLAGSYYGYGGWIVSVSYLAPDMEIGSTNVSCDASGQHVYVKSLYNEFCYVWNFPNG